MWTPYGVPSDGLKRCTVRFSVSSFSSASCFTDMTCSSDTVDAPETLLSGLIGTVNDGRFEGAYAPVGGVLSSMSSSTGVEAAVSFLSA